MTAAADTQQLETWPVYLLAGGESARFGSDKALALLDGKPLILHALGPFHALAGPAIAVVDRPDRLAGLELPVVVDAQPLRGPAHGLLTALRHRGQGWLWLAPCDVLGVQPSWLDALAAHAQAGRRAVAWRDAHWQPLPSLWHTDALPQVEHALADGRDALWQLLDDVGAQPVALPAEWSQLRRIDTQDALRQVQRERLAVCTRAVTQVRGAVTTRTLDALAIEAPLQVGVAQGALTRNLGVTLRTPGDDVELAVGLAFSEGALRLPGDVLRADATPDAVTLQLGPGAPPPVEAHARVRIASAACGACGKAELDVTDVISQVASADLRVPLSLLQTLPDVLRLRQTGLAATGALHAAGLFAADGTLLDVREDVGRHNAVDKLLGAAFLAGRLPLHDHVLVLSGRVAFELVQKAALAGLPVIVAVGAPSSLAVEVAEKAGITVLGFVRPERANVYTHPQRLD